VEYSDSNDEKDASKTKLPIKDVSLLSYVYYALTRGYLMEQEKAKFTEKRERVYSLFKIPKELEKFILFGFFQCLDAILYVFTFLPLRFIFAFIQLCIKGCYAPWMSRNSRVLEPAQICDLLKGLILIICCILIQYVDVSMLYHMIRGQSIIKLYIFFNMLEVADKMFSAFGQDVLDSLLWTATEPRGRRREHLGVFPHLILALIYVFTHTILVIVQATSLNVAFNSHNKALLTIMMSNNFVELKGSAFKKFATDNLFQMSCSDVRERFYLIILLSFVFVRNMSMYSWDIDHFWVLIPDFCIVMIAEVFIDWIKHCFICKFNAIDVKVYKDYNHSIAIDMTNSHDRKGYADIIDIVSRRMGFIPLPISIVIIQLVVMSVEIKSNLDITILILIYFSLSSFKVFLGITLLGSACSVIDSVPTSTITSPPVIKRSRSVGCNLDEHFKEPINKLNQFSTLTLNKSKIVEETELSHESFNELPHDTFEGVDRYTMCHNRII